MLGVGAHSWLDCIGRSDTEYLGPEQFFASEFYDQYCVGYPRAYPGRMNVDINTLFTYSVLDRVHTANVCPTQEKAYSEQFPMAKVKPGETIKLWYEMDNHLAPETQFHVWGYGVPDKELVQYSEQNDQTHLMSHVFATSSNCMNTNNVNTFCWAYWTIPSNWRPGIYSFVWNWHWDRNPKGEEYNTCFDLEVVDQSPTPIPNPSTPKCRPKVI
ncbi:hypothetical protein L0F63_003842 [Massospora cicadina]|nr:hypothetical protein L0F63_003842 [Massospora cicadina]